MTPVGPEPTIHYLLSKLSQEGFNEIVMMTGYLRDQIMGYLGDGSNLGMRITYVAEPDEFRFGTAGSLKLAEHLLHDTFLVAQADTLTEIPLREAVDLHRKSGALATIVLTRVHDPSDYGVAVLDEKNVITEFQEKPSKEEARSNLVSTGFYIMEPESLDYITDHRWDFAKDLFPRLLKSRKKLSGFVSDAFWVDIGNLEGYLRGVKWVVENLTQPQTAVAAELPNPVVMADRTALIGRRAQVKGPALIERDVTIEDEAKIGQYCVIKRNARISSGSVVERSVVMERAFVGKDCKITNSVVGASAVVQRNTTINGSIVGPGCVIGENVDIFNGSRVWPNIKIGANEKVAGILGTPLEKAFYFYSSFGEYTGILATTIDGFLDALEIVPIESVEFHTKRRDYERWTRDVLLSNELADCIGDIRRMAVTGERLRRDLIRVTQKWADEVVSPRAHAATHEILPSYA
jgi:NDP-sugar pyrophosphorylase family protein